MPGEVVVCEDVLYEGPLVSGMSPQQLAHKRADYFASIGMDAVKQLSSSYVQRFQQLGTFAKHQQLVLWYSQNLYNQLLLVQLLHWLEGQDTGRLEISLCTPDRLPVTRNIQSFELLSADQMESLYKRRLEVSINQLNIARAVWEAICSDDPRDIALFSRPDLASLPYLPDAVARLIQQFPAKANGLSLAEKQILEILYTGETEPLKVYTRVQRKEDFPFMNQMMFWLTVTRLLQAEHPAIELKEEYHEERVEPGVKRQVSTTHLLITDLGKRLLRNEDDWIQLNGIDRWIGGVHLNNGNIWRWDNSHRNLAKTYV